MNIVLSWLAIAGAALVLVAVAVAWFEHRRRMWSWRNDPAWFDTEVNLRALACAAVLDLSLDHHPHGQPAKQLDLSNEEREQAARQVVLTAALSRMARQKADPAPGNAWADTQPQANTAPPGSALNKTRTAVE